jgi:drug/metabolite transporter (DMT)-like permease
VATTAETPLVPARLASRPRAMAVAGALTIAFSAILVRLADVSPSTAAIFRCAYALPVLGLLATWEDRRFGVRPSRDRRVACAAGALLAADLIFWHHAIGDVGAGLGTVLGNLQVALVPLLAWVLLHEHPGRRVLVALPVVLVGVVLISGALENGAYGDDPARGVVFGLLTGLAYGGFILVLRHGSGDLRRVAGPLFDATLTATVVGVIAGLALGDADLVPSWPEHAWLVTLGLTSQALGWLLITVAMPRLPAALTSLLLTIQPVASVLLGAVLLSESPSLLQLAGTAAILAGVVAVSRPPARTPEPRPAWRPGAPTRRRSGAG